jgi:hypothetical protein
MILSRCGLASAANIRSNSSPLVGKSDAPNFICKHFLTYVCMFCQPLINRIAGHVVSALH